jgi:hypothetical protein
MSSHYNPPEVIAPLSTSDHNMVIWMAKIEGPEWGGGSQSHFHILNFGKIPVPVGFVLEIQVRVIEIPVNKKTRYLSVE